MKVWLIILTIWVILLHFKTDLFDNSILLAKTNLLTKTEEAHQGCLIIVPDGSAYIPIIFKDEITSNKFFQESNGTWFDKEFAYWDINRLFVPREFKNSKTE